MISAVPLLNWGGTHVTTVSLRMMILLHDPSPISISSSLCSTALRFVP